MRSAAALFTHTDQCKPAQQPPPTPPLPASARRQRQLRARGVGGHAASLSRRLLDAAPADAPADAPSPAAVEPASGGDERTSGAAGVDGGAVPAAADIGDPTAAAAVPVNRLVEGAAAEMAVAGAAAVVPDGGDVASPEEAPVCAPPQVAAVKGEEAYAEGARWAACIHAEMTANLRAQGWLGDYAPLRMNCPLLGRKVSAEAVPQFAAAAWDCDGLGFSWACLGHQEA